MQNAKQARIRAIILARCKSFSSFLAGTYRA